MKTNALIRIILFSLAIVVLLGILIAGIGVGYFFTFDRSSTVEATNQAQMAAGTDTRISNISPSATPSETIQPSGVSEANDTAIRLDAANIQELEIEWVAGSITVLPMENSDQITFSETQVEDKYKMTYRQAGNTLKIQFCEENRFTGIGINYDISKDLIITVPADWVCNELDIDAAAASVEVIGLTINDVDFDGASGICTFTDCTVGEMDVDTASGDVTFTGNLTRFSCSGMSANCKITTVTAPREIEIDSMSGDLDLTLPESCGFSVKMDGMSSKFNSDISTRPQNGRYVHGDGYCRIDVDAMSGEVTIHQAQ